jgi:hypothetical protein
VAIAMPVAPKIRSYAGIGVWKSPPQSDFHLNLFSAGKKASYSDF